MSWNLVIFFCRYLSLGNLGDANDLVDEVQKQMQDKELDYPHSELIEFINYLLET